ASTLDQKKEFFLSAFHFAVCGASTNETKNGTKALKLLVRRHKDMIPVNPSATTIQGIKCIKSLSELRDPTHPSVAIFVPPRITLEVLKLAKSLGIYAVWIQPGAEDDAVVQKMSQKLDHSNLWRSQYLANPFSRCRPAALFQAPLAFFLQLHRYTSASVI
ncbi:CoA binding domain-containing protein, partial [Mycena olivaceomarginata]